MATPLDASTRDLSPPGVAFATATATRARASSGETTTSSDSSAKMMMTWSSVLGDASGRARVGDDAAAMPDARVVRAETMRAAACMKTGNHREAREILFGNAFEQLAESDALSFAAMALRAEIPYHLNDPVGSLDALCALHARCASRARDETTSEDARARRGDEDETRRRARWRDDL